MSPAWAIPAAGSPGSEGARGPFVSGFAARTLPVKSGGVKTCHAVVAALFLGAASVDAVGAVGAPPIVAAVAEGAQQQLLRMTDFLDTMLPGTLGARNLTLHLTPKWADFRDREFIRLPLEVRYGVGEHLDVLGGFTPFGANPINAGRDRRWGLGETRVGVRYDLGPAWGFWDDTTVGGEVRVPLGRPPRALNDGYAHVKPFLSTEHRPRAWRHLRVYGNLSYDRSVVLRLRAAPGPEVVRRQVLEVVPGLLYKPKAWGGLVEYRWRVLREPAAQFHVHEARAGVVWEVPPERSARWRLPGNWQIEAAYRHEFTGERGRDPDSGVVTRVTWRTTLRGVRPAINGGAGAPPR